MTIARSTFDEFDEITAPSTPAATKVRVYAKTSGSGLFVKDSAGNEYDLRNAQTLKETITQTAHGFVVGDVIKRTSGSYAKAKADTSANARAVGIVESVPDANTFVVVTRGKVTGLSGLTDGTIYFLSAATAGAVVTRKSVV